MAKTTNGKAKIIRVCEVCDRKGAKLRRNGWALCSYCYDLQRKSN